MAHLIFCLEITQNHFYFLTIFIFNSYYSLYMNYNDFDFSCITHIRICFDYILLCIFASIFLDPVEQQKISALIYCKDKAFIFICKLLIDSVIFI